VFLILVAKLDLRIHVRCTLAHFGIQLRLAEPVECIHVLVLLMLRESLEDAPPVGFFNPLNLNRLEGPTAHYLVDTIDHGYCCAVF